MLRRLSFVLLLLPAGCFNSSSSPDVDANFGGPDGLSFPEAEPSDAAPPAKEAGADASMIVEAGTDATMVVEAGHDAAPQEAAVEAGPMPVTVVVSNAAGTEANVLVVFEDATGAVVQPVMTGTNGTVPYLAAAGSQVTVVLGTASAPDLVTIQSVAPGDTLSVYDPALDAVYTNELVNVASVPALPAGTNVLSATAGQNGYGYDPTPPAPFTVRVGTGDEVNGRFPVVVSAVGGADAGYETLGYTWAKNVALDADGGTPNVDITTPWISALTAENVTATNVPPFSYGAQGSVTYEQVAGGVAFTQYDSLVLADASTTYNFQEYPSFPDSVQTEFDLISSSNLPNATGVSVSALATQSTAPAAMADASFDLSTFMPWITSSTSDSTTPAQPSTTWTTSDAGDLSNIEGTVVVLAYSVPSDGGETGTGTWTIIAPPTATQVQAPQLPPAQAAWAPSASSPLLQPTVVMFVGATFLPDYAATRALAGAVPFGAYMSAGYTGGIVVPPLPKAGTLWLTGYAADAE